MKKTQLLSLLMLIPIIASCGQKKVAEPTWSDENEEVCIADFEKWGPDFQIMGLINDFGKVTRNEDKKYNHSGNYSAHIQPLGQYGSPSKKPLLYLPLISKVFDFNRSDISRLNDVKCYLYNDSNVEKKVTVGFVSSINAYKYISKVDGQEFTLAPNAWTRITYVPNLAYLNIQFDIKNTAALYFEFEHTNSRELEDAPNIYLDDVYFELSKDEKNLEQYEPLKENEICDFEEEYQQSYISPGWPNEIIGIFDYKIVTGEYHGLSPTSGNKMLHLNFKAGNRSDWANWANICLSEKYIRKTKIMQIEQADLPNWKLSFDVAGLGPSTQKIVPIFYKTNRSADFRDYTFDAYNNEWHTFSMPLKEEYYSITSNAGDFLFSLPEEIYGYEVFIDNIRLERVD